MIGHFDEPSRDVLGPEAAFNGWIASDEPIRSVVLAADGRKEDVSVYERQDARHWHDRKYVVGWQHSMTAGPHAATRKTFKARLIVNNRKVCSKTFAWLPQAVPEPLYNGPEEAFFALAEVLESEASVLEVGTKQAVEGSSTHLKDAFPKVPRSRYVMADIGEGSDVDIVADLHALPEEWGERFRAVVACAVFEHLERPWIAAREIARVLKPGGFAYISTHQTYPLHGYPSDFFRFSKEALSLIFTDAGLTIESVGYKYRTQITAPHEGVPVQVQSQWNADWPSYLIVNLLARKPG